MWVFLCVCDQLMHRNMFSGLLVPCSKLGNLVVEALSLEMLLGMTRVDVSFILKLNIGRSMIALKLNYILRSKL